VAINKRLNKALDDLTAYPKAVESEYVPRTEYDGSSGGYIQTGPMDTVPADHADLLKQFGYDPEQVRVVGSPRVSKWQVWRRKDDGPSWLTAYRFQIAPVSSAATLDLEAIIKRAKSKPAAGTGPHWFVYQCSDTQIGKIASGGGVEETCERWAQSVDAARNEFKLLKRLGIEGIQISFPGDCTEGGVSQGGRNLGFLSIPVTEQVRVLRRMMLYTIEQFAPLVDQIFVDTVNGNHDQSDRTLNSWPGDGWATETAIAVDDALKINPAAYGHVTVRVPDKWNGHMTVPVGDTVVTVIHGHQYRRGQGMQWWASQAHNGQPAGAAQIMQSGHFHEWQIQSSARKVWIQSSTLDTGSDWFKDKTGAEARRGGLVYLLAGGEVSRMSVV
jgi:predicted phosphodiesterase